MSMLTPPGMGGKYRVTGDTFPRMRRTRSRGRTLLIAVALLMTVGVLGWGTLQLIDVFSGKHKKADALPISKCAAAPNSSSAKGAPHRTLPTPSSITVNVYNATPRAGLARSAANELKKRGFKIGEVGNASTRYDKKVAESALLIAGPKAHSALTVLGTQIKGARSTSDKRKDSSVDLVIGRAYTELNDAKTAEQALTTLAKPTKTASPSLHDCRS